MYFAKHNKKLQTIPEWTPPEFDFSEFDDVILILPAEYQKSEQPQRSVFEPTSFKEFIGQEPTKKILEITIGAALKTKKPLPNILLTGVYGHGKTTLARLIAERAETSFQIIDGANAETLLASPKKDVLYIIDEIHNISSVLSDSINILIDQQKIHLIGCTTSPGKLQAPLRSRLRLLYLDDYTAEDISKIILAAAQKVDIVLHKNVQNTISKRSKLNPRNALSILAFMHEMAIVEQIKCIDSRKMEAALKILRIDEMGLTELDRKYLEALNYNKPVGLKSVSSALSLDTQTIEEQIEPYLLKIGLIERTARGRILVYPQENSNIYYGI